MPWRRPNRPAWRTSSTPRLSSSSPTSSSTRARAWRSTRMAARRFWVTSEVGGTLSVIDATTYKVVKKVGFEIEGVRSELIQPLGIRFSMDGKRGFVALGRANRIAVVDVEKLEVTNYILVGQRPWHMEMSPDRSTSHRQRPHQRRDDHRRRHAEGGEVGSRWTLALGHRHQALRPPAGGRLPCSAASVPTLEPHQENAALTGKG